MTGVQTCALPICGVALVFNSKKDESIKHGDVIVAPERSIFSLPLHSHYTFMLITLRGLGYLTSPRSEAHII